MTVNEADPGGSIPQTNPLAGYLASRQEIDAAVARVLSGGRYILGDEVAAFEREFGAYLGRVDCVGVASGTDAIELSLRALDVGAGDAVVAPSLTSSATIAAIIRCGAVPVVADVVDGGYTIDPASVIDILRIANAPASTRRVRAVIAVHLYGEPADLTPLLEIAHDSEAFLIEDCAQAHGAAFDGRRVGTFGDAAAFSFYPTKNLGAFGDGGLVATRDPWLTSRLRMLREYGWERRQLVSIPGGVNSRLDEIQAAILRVKLTSLENDNARRRELAVRYDAGLAEVRGIMLPPGERTGHAFHQYVIGVAGRDELKAFLDSVGIGTAIHYTVPSHLQPGFRDLVATPVPLAHTERACGHILSLPMYPELEIDSVDAVTSAIRDWMTRR